MLLVTSSLIAKGNGTVKWNFYGISGKKLTIEASAYWVPDFSFWIFHRGRTSNIIKRGVWMNHMGVYFVANGKRVDLSYNNANLPYARATTAGIEADTATIEVNVCGSEENINLTGKGKLLLLWHQQLCHASCWLVRW